MLSDLAPTVGLSQLVILHGCNGKEGGEVEAKNAPTYIHKSKSQNCILHTQVWCPQLIDYIRKFYTFYGADYLESVTFTLEFKF